MPNMNLDLNLKWLSSDPSTFIAELLSELDLTPSSLCNRYSSDPLVTDDNHFELKLVDSESGDGDGAEIYQVWAVLDPITKHQYALFEFDGIRNSYDANYWEDPGYLVEPYQVTVTRYKKAESPKQLLHKK